MSAESVPDIVGLDFVGRGFNAVSNLKGLGQITLNTFSEDWTWKNTITNKTYLVPIEMMAQMWPDSTFTNDTTSFNGIMDYQQWEYHHYSWHSGWFGMVSHSKTTYEFLEQYYKNDQSLALSTLDIGFLKLSAPVFPPLTTTAMFQKEVAALPSSCCNDTSGYRKFVEFFTNVGTHFMDSAILGGRLLAQTWYAKCFITTKSESWVKEQSSWNFLDIVGEGKGSSTTKYNTSVAFKNCVKAEFSYEGGNTSLRPNQYRSWAKSLFDLPSPISFTLQPISKLFTDQEQSKVTPVNQALKKYLTDSQNSLDAAEKEAAKHDPHLNPKCCKDA